VCGGGLRVWRGSACDLGTSKMRQARLNLGCCGREKNVKIVNIEGERNRSKTPIILYFR